MVGWIALGLAAVALILAFAALASGATPDDDYRRWARWQDRMDQQMSDIAAVARRQDYLDAAEDSMRERIALLAEGAGLIYVPASTTRKEAHYAKWKGNQDDHRRRHPADYHRGLHRRHPGGETQGPARAAPTGGQAGGGDGFEGGTIMLWLPKWMGQEAEPPAGVSRRTFLFLGAAAGVAAMLPAVPSSGEWVSLSMSRVPPFHWALIVPDSLPMGIALDRASGRLAGTAQELVRLAPGIHALDPEDRVLAVFYPEPVVMCAGDTVIYEPSLAFTAA
jgi:hypothetical protein